MPTKLISKALLGALSAAMMAAPAFAGGNCAGGNCNIPVQVLPGYAPQFGPMTVQNNNPLGHLSSVNFQRAPHVSITRVHGLAPSAALSDAPSGFTGGCHPSSTTYCRQGGNHAAPAPVQAPVYAAPVVSAPVVSAPQVVRIGGGYDASKFTPRTYGDATLVPGIAYLPTSHVVRDPAAAQQVLDTGRAVPQPVVVPGTGRAPNLGMVRQNTGFQNFSAQGASFGQNTAVQSFGVQRSGLVQAQGLALAPTRQGPSFGQPGVPLLQQSGPFAGSYGSKVAGDGTYWEKVSGPTAFGDTIATSVICKRKVEQRVVRPVVGVPVPVAVPVTQGCESTTHDHRVGQPHKVQSFGPLVGAPSSVGTSRYSQAVPGRWVQ